MYRFSAPAKLNLFLHITGRRPDGYHALQTVFQLLDFGDTLQFTPRQDGQLQFSCSESTLAGEDNLVLRAARLLQPIAGPGAGCSIHLDKHLPAEAGLGGGSSDAATTLQVLNRLWHCRLDTAELLRLGARLGADVPVFVAGHSAWAEGTGERLQPVDLPARWYLVLTPRCGAATGQIFGHPELTRNSPPLRIPAFPFSGTRNDCEPVACLLHPEIKQALEWLGKYATARMTGTGSSVFAAFEDEATAQAVLASVAESAPPMRSAFVARGVNRSPLLAQLDRFAQLA